MKNIVRVILPMLILAFVPHVAAADTAPAPASLRHLVYAYTYSMSTDLTQHDSGLDGGPASGTLDDRGSVTDKGNITVDVLAEASDGGLVVSVSQTARGTRVAEPAKCAIYGDTGVKCDPTKTVNQEEYAALRLLGRGFFDTSKLDAKNHWQIANDVPSGSIKSDFTVDSNDGTIAKITEQVLTRDKTGQGTTSTTDGKITYNVAKSAPISVYEDTTSRRSAGSGDYETDHLQITLDLTSDTFGAV